MVDGLLQTLGLVTGGHKGTSITSGGALLNSGGLGQGLVVGLDAVDNDSPFSVSVDSSQGLKE